MLLIFIEVPIENFEMKYAQNDEIASSFSPLRSTILAAEGLVK